MKKKNIPKIIDFSENQLFADSKKEVAKPKKNKPKKAQPKKPTKANKKVVTKKRNTDKKETEIKVTPKHEIFKFIEYHDLSTRIEPRDLKLHKIDYCIEDVPVVVEKKSKPKVKDTKKPDKVIQQKPLQQKKEEKPIIVAPPIKEKIVVDTPKEVKPVEINNQEILLEVINLRKQYSRKSKPAIDKLNFKVYRGQFHAFIGANGAGKTTTIKSIVGAYANYEGQVKISGLDNREKMSKAKLGYIPEIARFPSRISAFNYLKSMAMLNRLSSKDAEEFAKNILIEFKMYDLKDVSPNKFSSGQKKKILLGQALSNDPDILIMDEPAANLDPKARIDFFNILKNLQKRGKSIFISSHILSELDLYADSLTILDGGKIVYTGTRHDESHFGNKYAYRINLLKENDFGNYNVNKFTVEQSVEDPKHYIVSSNDKHAIGEFVAYLFKNNKTDKIELYRLSIEDMYKKYVILGSVHTGYKVNANSTLELENK